MILIAGGSGRLGTRVAARLSARGVPLRVLSRDAARAAARLIAAGCPPGERLEMATGDVRDAASIGRAMSGVTLVISAVQGFEGSGGVTPASVDRDGNRHLIEAAAAARAGVVLMSVIGADRSSPMELFRMKAEAEEALRASGAPGTVVRASAFLELWLEILQQTAGRGGRPLVFGHGDNPINFVSVEDVADVVARAALDPATRGAVIEIGGARNLTFNELAAALQTSLGHTRPPRHVPRAVLHVAGAIAGVVRPSVGRQMHAALAMDSMDLRFDPAALRSRYPDLPAVSLEQLLAAHREVA